MTIQDYSMFAGVTVIAVIILMRAFYYATVAKVDPIKSLTINTGVMKILRWDRKKIANKAKQLGS